MRSWLYTLTVVDSRLKKWFVLALAWVFGGLGVSLLLGLIAGQSLAQAQEAGQSERTTTNIVSQYDAQERAKDSPEASPQNLSPEDAAKARHAAALQAEAIAVQERAQQRELNKIALFDAIRIDDGAGVFDLIWNKADPNVLNERGEPALVWALKYEAYRAAKTLALSPDIDFNLTNASGEDALMLASLRGQTELVEKMLQGGAKPNKSGWTALHYAATAASIPIMQKLLAAGAKINAQAPQQLTPLMMAARHGNDLSVQLLVNAGANYLAKDNQGRSVADYAAGAGKDELAEKLRVLIRARSQRP